MVPAERWKRDQGSSKFSSADGHDRQTHTIESGGKYFVTTGQKVLLSSSLRFVSVVCLCSYFFVACPCEKCLYFSWFVNRSRNLNVPCSTAGISSAVVGVGKIGEH